jgi:hypothetical protein
MLRILRRFFLLIFMACLSGCAALGLTVPVVAVSGGTAGVEYSISNNAYKTISYPIIKVEAALKAAFDKMKITETGTEKKAEGVVVSAIAGDHTIIVELERITPAVTKIEVDAKKDVVVKDKATATEIIVQTEKALEAKNQATEIRQ